MEDVGAEEVLVARQQAECVGERVWLAVEGLCTGQGEVRDRIEAAFGTLEPLRLRPRDFPEEVREDFEGIMAQITQLVAANPHQGSMPADAQDLLQVQAEAHARLAERGDADAQFELGDACFHGRGVQRNDAEAMKWWRKAAEQGHAGAQGRLQERAAAETGQKIAGELFELFLDLQEMRGAPPVP